MPWIHIPRPWKIRESLATSQSVYKSRRKFLGQTGLGGIAVLSGACSRETGLVQPVAGGNTKAEAVPEPPLVGGPTAPYRPDLYPARRDRSYVLDRDVTDEAVAAATINYYEFTTDKPAVADMAKDFSIRPWTIEVAGLVEKPRTWGMEDLLDTFDLEERLYRHRCVEAWAMAVPWTGFPLARFIQACRPLSSARFVRFISFLRPEDAPGQERQVWYPWPYFEGLTMEEATNELSLLVTGIYGHSLPNHHGAPLRLVVPWKDGYKSIKGIVRIEFTGSRPETFWNTVQPAEYGFVSNVNPAVPHPRWSQAQERLIGTGLTVDTQPYNGYGQQVAHLYS